MKPLSDYIPIDKSLAIRVLCLDILNKTSPFTTHKKLSDDIQHAVVAASTWHNKKDIVVGEAGTLLRFLRYIAWHTNVEKKFILHGTLLSRKVGDTAIIYNLDIPQLLKLDGNTSQWACAAYLCGKRGLPDKIPFKLQQTVSIVEDYPSLHFSWFNQLDKTIESQAKAYLVHKNENLFSKWSPIHSEDFCFARVFNFITSAEGENRWPQLRNHESDRISEIELGIYDLENTGEIASKDHRVVQAIVLYALSKGIKYNCRYPDAVNKSWPQFWDFCLEMQQRGICA